MFFFEFCEFVLYLMLLIHLSTHDILRGMSEKCIILELGCQYYEVLFLLSYLMLEADLLFLDLLSIDMCIDIDVDTMDDAIGKSRSLLWLGIESDS